MVRLWRFRAGTLQLVPRTVYELAGLERIIAAARLVVACTSLLSARLSWPAPPQFTVLAAAVLVVYFAYAVLLVVLLIYKAERVVRRRNAVQAMDLAWAAGLTSITGATSSHFSPLLFVFALLAAAYRWGFSETILTGVAAVMLVLLQGAGAALGLLGVPLQRGDLIMRAVWLTVVASILGYLAEWNERLRSEAAALAQLGRRVRVQDGLNASVRSLASDVARMFGAELALVAAEDLPTGRVFVWQAQRTAEGVYESDGTVEARGASASGYTFPVPAQVGVWAAVSNPRRGPSIRALDADGHRVDATFAVPDQIGGGTRWSSVVSLAATPIENWRARVFLVNPAANVTRDRSLRFLQTIVRQVGPAIANIYLVRRLRSKIEEFERARIARELHDGVIQSLVGLEFELEVVRQKAERDPATAATSLESLQSTLRDEIAEVRKLMAQIRSPRVDGRTLVDSLRRAVSRFNKGSRIEAAFRSDVEEVQLSPWVCQEILRIAEEALVNVRKHSGARAVEMTLDALAGGWRLAVEDDGQGFDFAGRLSMSDMEALGAGPAVLMERVRSIEGRLWIDSLPGRGSRVEILIAGPRDGASKGSADS